MTDQNPLEVNTVTINNQLNIPEPSGWKCYLFGSRSAITYFPAKGNVPNRFVRFMMRVCFDCLWVKTQEDN